MELRGQIARPLVVLPTYNEAANITTMLERIADAVPSASVLIVDDASPDGTADEAERAASRLPIPVTVMRRSGKLGLGTAYRAGFQWGIDHGHDAVIQMDSDFQHDPAAVPALIGALDGGADMAIGSRYVEGGSIPPTWPWYRRELSRWGNRYASTVLALHVQDTTAGFRAHRASFLAEIDLASIDTDGYGFQVQLTYRARRTGGVIVEVPIAFGERLHGESKMSGRIIVEAFFMATRIGIRDRLRSREPRRAA
jgi:dolichol-phosphate mannosyltransferase